MCSQVIFTFFVLLLLFFLLYILNLHTLCLILNLKHLTLLTDAVVFLVNTVMLTSENIVRTKLCCGDNDAVTVFESFEFV